jgi:hypothetical protein
MADANQKLLRYVMEMRRQMGQMVRMGTVSEVKGDKVRMNMGKDGQGKDILSPWLPHASMYGGERSRPFYKKGQNVTMLMVNGDPLQSIILPFAPNQKNKAPSHANKSGQDESVWQMDDLRVKKTKDGYTIWRQPEQQQQDGQQGQQGQSGGSGGGGGDSDAGAGGGGGGGAQDVEQPEGGESDADGEKAEQVIRLDKDGGVTLRFGKDARVHVAKKRVKFKFKKEEAWIDEKGLWVTKPWQIAKPPQDDDDKV